MVPPIRPAPQIATSGEAPSRESMPANAASIRIIPKVDRRIVTVSLFPTNRPLSCLNRYLVGHLLYATRLFQNTPLHKMS